MPKFDRSAYPHQSLTQAIIGAFFDVYNELGAGFVESVYEKALYLELLDRKLNVRQQQHVPVHFKGQPVGVYRADLVVDDTVVIELKALRQLESQHQAQLLNLLKASGLGIGLLLNFGPKPEIKRLIRGR